MEQSGFESEYYVNLITTRVNYWFSYKGTKRVVLFYVCMYVCMYVFIMYVCMYVRMYVIMYYVCM